MDKKMPVVEVAKYQDRIPVTLNTNLDIDKQIEHLVDMHGAGAVFIDGKSAAEIKAEREPAQDHDEFLPPAASMDTLLGSSRHDALIKVGERDVQLGELVAAAHTRSGLAVSEWNELPDADRELLIDKEIATLSAKLEIPAADTTANPGGAQ